MAADVFLHEYPPTSLGVVTWPGASLTVGIPAPVFGALQRAAQRRSYRKCPLETIQSKIVAEAVEEWLRKHGEFALDDQTQDRLLQARRDNLPRTPIPTPEQAEADRQRWAEELERNRLAQALEQKRFALADYCERIQKTIREEGLDAVLPVQVRKLLALAELAERTPAEALAQAGLSTDHWAVKALGVPVGA